MRSRAGLRGFRMTAVVCGLAIAAGALVTASGVLADARPSGPQAVHAQLAYRCRFPAGPRLVSVTVAGTFPSTAVAGQPIKVSGLRTTMAFPPPVTAGLRKLGAARVTGRDVLGVGEADNAQTGTAKAVTALWPGRVRKPVPVPASGRLHLTFSGPVPPMTVRAPGTVTFTAGALNVALTIGTARGLTSTPVTCTLTSVQRAVLTAVQVTAATTRPGHTGAARHAKGPAISTGGLPPGCGKKFIHGGTSEPVLGCAYLIGYADVQKLNGAALVGPAANGAAPGALLNVDTYGGDFGCVPTAPSFAACAKIHGTVHAYNCTAARLDFDKQLSFPPAEATFLGFNFVPVTAIMQLSETTWPSSNPPVEDPRCYKGFNTDKPVQLKSPLVSVFSDIDTDISLGEPILSVGTTYLAIHVSQVAVNGVPLNVGADCGTTQPVHAVLTGHGINLPAPSGYTLAGGGPLTGTVTIPPFEHCGVGENLDPLFTASISGPANFQLITQGVLCTPQQGATGCPPVVPKPLRHVDP